MNYESNAAPEDFWVRGDAANPGSLVVICFSCDNKANLVPAYDLFECPKCKKNITGREAYEMWENLKK